MVGIGLSAFMDRLAPGLTGGSQGLTGGIAAALAQAQQQKQLQAKNDQATALLQQKQAGDVALNKAKQDAINARNRAKMGLDAAKGGLRPKQETAPAYDARLAQNVAAGDADATKTVSTLGNMMRGYAGRMTGNAARGTDGWERDPSLAKPEKPAEWKKGALFDIDTAARQQADDQMGNTSWNAALQGGVLGGLTPEQIAKEQAARPAKMQANILRNALASIDVHEQGGQLTPDEANRYRAHFKSVYGGSAPPDQGAPPAGVAPAPAGPPPAATPEADLAEAAKERAQADALEAQLTGYTPGPPLKTDPARFTNELQSKMGPAPDPIGDEPNRPILDGEMAAGIPHNWLADDGTPGFTTISDTMSGRDRPFPLLPDLTGQLGRSRVLESKPQVPPPGRPASGPTSIQLPGGAPPFAMPRAGRPNSGPTSIQLAGRQRAPGNSLNMPPLDMDRSEMPDGDLDLPGAALRPGTEQFSQPAGPGNERIHETISPDYEEARRQAHVLAAQGFDASNAMDFDEGEVYPDDVFEMDEKNAEVWSKPTQAMVFTEAEANAIQPPGSPENPIKVPTREAPMGPLESARMTAGSLAGRAKNALVAPGPMKGALASARDLLLGGDEARADVGPRPTFTPSRDQFVDPTELEDIGGGRQLRGPAAAAWRGVLATLSPEERAQVNVVSGYRSPAAQRALRSKYEGRFGKKKYRDLTDAEKAEASRMGIGGPVGIVGETAPSGPAHVTGSSLDLPRNLPKSIRAKLEAQGWRQNVVGDEVHWSFMPAESEEAD